MPPAAPIDRATAGTDNQIAVWLLVCCAMVFVMVVLGGVTRLTESGLSIVDWRPAAGILPPMSEAAWQEVFRDYRATPEFRKVNFWMTLVDFKAIYWMEFSHRVWGRAIGIAFLLPFLYFLWRRRLDRGLAAKLGLIFVLGGLQGVLGWYMVRSGLVDRPDVSQYRLAAHLGLALIIYACMLWLALGLLGRGSGATGALRRHGWVMLVWVFLTVISGAFVAGLDAGRAYNTFPLMDGQLIPDGLFAVEPWPINFFENAATVQFTHRLMAIVMLLIVLALWFRARTGGVGGAARRAADFTAIMVCVQAGLGIATLLSEVDIAIAGAHQAGAMLRFTFALWTVREITRSP